MQGQMSKRLRILLEEMTRDCRVPIDTYPATLATIRRKTAHTIRVLSAPLDEPLTEFNCVMHALGLVGRIEDPSGKGFNRWYADLGFLQSLIDRGILKPCAPTPGAVVTWSSAGRLRHVGVLVTRRRAASKWGIGYLYEHALLQVPTNYGDDLAFYSPLEPEDALNRLKAYYAVTGVSG